MKDYKHLLFVVLIGVGVGAVSVAVGYLLIPESFGWRDGLYYREVSLDDEKQDALRYAAAGSCSAPECHGEGDHKVVMEGLHTAVACQACHGPSQAHVAAEGARDAPLAPKEIALCMDCHLTVEGRPAGYKQIPGFKEHLAEKGGEDQSACVDCHDPHTKELRVAESACLSAECHGENAPREELKIVLKSGHKALKCERCHGPPDAIERHIASKGKTDKPAAPTDISLCMGCHQAAPGAPPKDKQITSFEEHREDMGGDEEENCVACHDPHTGEDY